MSLNRVNSFLIDQFLFCIHLQTVWPLKLCLHIKITIQSPLANLRTLCPQKKFVTKREVTNIPTILYWLFSYNGFDETQFVDFPTFLFTKIVFIKVVVCTYM